VRPHPQRQAMGEAAPTTANGSNQIQMIIMSKNKKQKKNKKRKLILIIILIFYYQLITYPLFAVSRSV
jgi:predicted nucleic acid-binding Zn ribbon protein